MRRNSTGHHGEIEILEIGGELQVFEGGVLDVQRGATVKGLPIAGTYVITPEDAAAGRAVIATGLMVVDHAIVQVVNGDNAIVIAGAVVRYDRGSVIVENGGDYETVAGTRIVWLASGH